MNKQDSVDVDYRLNRIEANLHGSLTGYNEDGSIDLCVKGKVIDITLKTVCKYCNLGTVTGIV